MDWEGLRRNVPAKWIQVLKNNPTLPNAPIIPTSLLMLLKQKKGCQVIHKILQKSHHLEKPNFKVKWERDLDQTLETNTWKIICKNPFLATWDPKLQEFQFKIIHRILPTNSFLYKARLKDSENCSVCNTQKETILHKFVECPNVQSFWTEFIDWMNTKGYNIISLNAADILFNIFRNNMIISLFVLIAKYHIYTCGRLDKQINFEAVKSSFKYYYKLERVIAHRKNKMNLFLGKWAQFVNEFNAQQQ